MSDQTRQTNNMPIAKRAAIQFFTTIAAIARHRDERWESTELGRIHYETRELFGRWNSVFPSTLQLRGLAHELGDMADATGDPDGIEAVLLNAMAEVCTLVARTASPAEAVRQITTSHGVLLEAARRATGGDGWFFAFGRARTREFNKLLSQLR